MKHKLFLLALAAFLMMSFACILPVNAKDKENKTEGTYTVAVIDTEKGVMKAVLFTDEAPITTKNFIGLANDNFYKNMNFHRVVKDFVIQTGDPTGSGSGGSSKMIPLEINKKLKHKRGALAMARKESPDSATSQFYIAIEKQPNLDGHYAVFGQVYEGMDVIGTVEQGDALNSVKIIEVDKKDVKF